MYKSPVSTILNKYYNEYYPFDTIYAMIVFNKEEKISPETRMIRFHCKKENGFVYENMHFDRINKEYFKKELYHHIPESIHLSYLYQFHLPKRSFHESYIKEKNIIQTPLRTLKRISSPLNNDYIIKQQQQQKQLQEDSTPPKLKEIRDKHFIHFNIDKQKELVFDIDIPDYNRFCKCDKEICQMCWLHLEGSFHIMMKLILTEILGYDKKNILVVFSGNKGLHFIINDKSCLSLNKQQRKFIYDTIFNIGNGKDNINDDLKLMRWIKQYNTEDISTFLERYFIERVLKERNLLVKSESFNTWIMKKLELHYHSIYCIIQKKWNQIMKEKKLSVDLWECLKTMYQYDESIKNDKIIEPHIFIIYRLYFPIIDKGPIQLNHQCKTPFSIHHKTLNIALPIDQVFIDQSYYNKISNGIVNMNDLYNDKEKQSVFKKSVSLMNEWINCY